MTRVDWRAGALDELASSPEMRSFLGDVADDIVDQARTNARAFYPGTNRVRAIAKETGVDAESAYADVGYTPTHPGFVLWWSEVGTQHMSPRPHLRAALQQVRL